MVVIVCTLAFMWIFGETQFIVNSQRERKAEQIEFEEIRRQRTEEYEKREGNSKAVVPVSAHTQLDPINSSPHYI